VTVVVFLRTVFFNYYWGPLFWQGLCCLSQRCCWPSACMHERVMVVIWLVCVQWISKVAALWRSKQAWMWRRWLGGAWRCTRTASFFSLFLKNKIEILKKVAH